MNGPKKESKTTTKSKYVMEKKRRDSMRIPLPTSKNKSIEGGDEYRWKAQIKDIKESSTLEGDYEVLNLSYKGAAIFLDEENYEKYNNYNMAIYVSFSKGSKTIEPPLMAQVRNKSDESKGIPNGSHILRVEFLDWENQEEGIANIKENLSSESNSYLNGYIDSPNFRELVKEEVKLNKDESLYKYLDRVLRFMDNFINSDLGMVGYVVQNEEGKEVISVEDTIFIGHSSDKFKREIIIAKSKHEPLEVLKENNSVNFTENQNLRYSCMAHSQISGDLYFIKYPQVPEGKEKCSKEDYEDWWQEINESNHGCMNLEDKEAARAGKFSRTNNDFLAEITVPIIPDKEDEAIALLNFELVKPKVSISERDLGESLFNILITCKEGIIIKDEKKGPDYAYFNGNINTEDDGVDLSDRLGSIKKIKDEDKRKVLDIWKESINKREHGFYEDVTRRIVQTIREEVEFQIAGAIFEHYKDFQMILYHTMINYLMGESHHALNELGKWREVQCRNMFRKYECHRDIFKGYQEFLTQEAHFFDTNFPDLKSRDQKLYELYNKFLNIQIREDENRPDSGKDGCGGIGMFHTIATGKLKGEELIAIQRLFIPILQLHFILEEIVKQDTNTSNFQKDKYSIYLKKAGNIAIQIEQDNKSFDEIPETYNAICGPIKGYIERIDRTCRGF